jgi:hypothetical protein
MCRRTHRARAVEKDELRHANLLLAAGGSTSPEL